MIIGKEETLLKNVPVEVWNSLPQPDRDALFNLKNQLNQKPKQNGKFHKTFHTELEKIRDYVNKSESLQQERSIVAGVHFAPNLLCVNTQQLKKLLNRCKSSINNSFQQLGFLSTKSKVRKYIESYLPILQKYPKILRQWTVRYSEPPKPAIQFKKIFLPKRIQYPVPMIIPSAPAEMPSLSISCSATDPVNNHEINFYDDFTNDKDPYPFTPMDDDSQMTFEWDIIDKGNNDLSFQSEFNDEPTIDYQND